eukprot:67506-Chlamydomonas_euryale.AAC.5
MPHTALSCARPSYRGAPPTLRVARCGACDNLYTRFDLCDCTGSPAVQSGSASLLGMPCRHVAFPPVTPPLHGSMRSGCVRTPRARRT